MAGVAFYFSDELIKFIRIPFGDIPLYNIQVTGTFYAYLKISLFSGVFAALPIHFLSDVVVCLAGIVPNGRRRWSCRWC